MSNVKYHSIQIEAYNLAEFCQKVQDAFLEGFRFDLATNQNYPTAFGAFYSAGMLFTPEEKKEEKIEEQTTSQVEEEVQDNKQDTQEGGSKAPRASKKA